MIVQLQKEERASLRTLARRLCVSQQFLSQVGNRERSPSPKLKLRLMKEKKMPMTRENILLLLPDDIAAEVRGMIGPKKRSAS